MEVAFENGQAFSALVPVETAAELERRLADDDGGIVFVDAERFQTLDSCVVLVVAVLDHAGQVAAGDELQAAVIRSDLLEGQPDGDILDPAADAVESLILVPGRL